ncbi:zinc-finger homeodomain protein 2 isoform X3 [Jatropha curcas]|uniref:zinc-finger homeodomain protein 2 isoform X3 n=1 Tax=Jatropha curcas TaxID=180498 RepID=UPI00189539A7|nr:zinc-finger homeodomain protein 2 isoform X3 [Jatropha curcas]
MDFDDEHEDQEEEMGMPVPAGYDAISNSARPKMGPGTGGAGEGGGGGGEGASTIATATNTRKSGSSVRYRECLKNHAVNIGGHAVDGCGEFMAAGEKGTLDALKCAACNCHRNFHRKETDGGGEGIYHHHQQHYPQFSPFYRAPPPAGYLHLTPPTQHRPLALPAASGGGAGGDVVGGGYSREEEDVSNPSSSGGGGGGVSGGSKKRFRTKFTQEQKDKMLDFAERLGWRIQKHDEVAVEQFCGENGVKRHVLKVWMHNNKHTLAVFFSVLVVL